MTRPACANPGAATDCSGFAIKRNHQANRLAREYAPLASLGVFNEVTLVSSRVGCIVLRPVLDLAVACLK